MLRFASFRTAVSVAAILILALTALGIIGAAWWGWTFALPTRDHVVVINVVVALAAYILVALSVAVALFAYLAATGRPDLHAVIQFNFSYRNEPVFEASDESSPDGNIKLRQYKQLDGTVSIENRTSYAARNPGVRIELSGIGGFRTQPGWASVAFASTVGLIAIQWDGGADLLIHGKWPRPLPRLDFSDAYAFKHIEPELIVTVVADGFMPRVQRIPIRVLNEQEYDAYTEERSRHYLEGDKELSSDRSSLKRLFRR